MATNTIPPPDVLHYGRWRLIRYGAGLILLTAASLVMWPGLLKNLFASNYLAHGYCLGWQSRLLYLHVTSDLLIGISYVAISFTLAYLVHRARRDIPFQWIFLAFGLFIIACGGTHFMEVVTLWKPIYWVAGYVKLITAIASVATAIVLPPLVPKTLAMIRAAKMSEERKLKLEAANAELSALTAKLRDMDEVKTAFFANVSHELRTPLALILGRSEKMLASSTLSDEHRRELHVVHRNSRLLLKHVNDLLDVSKLEAGKMNVTYTPVDLARFVRRTAAHFESVAAERGIAYTYRGPESLSATVDPEKLERVLLNLLSNAFKFTPEGGVVRCELRSADGCASIEVADNGPGVRPELRELIFERFRQGDNRPSRHFGGTGLGLAIVKDFVELHYGEVSIGAAPEGGALFTVRLPLRAPAQAVVSPLPAIAEPDPELADEALETLQAPPAAPEQADDVESALASAPLVLVVEDNLEMNRFIVESLAADYRVARAGDGREGLERALALHPDLIISDIMMPEISGDELVRRLRANPVFDAVPIILLTAKADPQARVKVLRDGAQDYIMKPFSVEELRARARNLIALSGARRVLQQELQSQNQDVQELAHELSFRRRQLHAALEALRRSESRFRRLVESNIIGVITISLDGAITDANDAFLQLLGYSREELIASRLNWKQLTPPECLAADEQALAELRATGIAVPREKEYLRKDGQRVSVLVGVAMLEGTTDSGIAFVLDLTELKRAQRDRSELAAIVDSTDDAIFAKDLDGTITTWNAAAERMYGYPAAAAIGRHVSLIVPEDRTTELASIVERLRRGQSLDHIQTVRKTRDGRLLEVALTVSPVKDASGRIIGASTIARDITHQKRAEEALRNSEKLATVGRLAATIAHEINNPLESVANLLYLLRHHTARDAAAAQYVTLAEQEIERIAHIVKQTLGFYRESPTPVAVNLPTLVDNILELYSRKLAAKNVSVVKRYGLASDIPAFPGEMRQVISNLLTNAIEANGAGGAIEIRVHASRDWANPDRCGVRVVVADNGSGISVQHRAHIFEPFFTTKGEKGTGLGLWVSRGIVAKHGGSMRAFSSTRPGRSGTVFSVFLPSEPVHPAHSAADSDPFSDGGLKVPRSDTAAD